MKIMKRNIAIGSPCLTDIRTFYRVSKKVKDEPGVSPTVQHDHPGTFGTTSGCSPCGLWRKSDGFLINSTESVKAGMQHILNTCMEGDMLKAKNRLDELLKLPVSSCPDTALELAVAIDDEGYCKTLMNKFLGKSCCSSQTWRSSESRWPTCPV